ncbi:HNH endonuclease signature motif containing protein [Actinomyces ruminicola]|uniref:HNH endonuclease signature motif containing protein n=1 Tax=Actinomyces ruminicola TaxID=332524 RepID=UPI0021C4445C|nr:HNH endonuclease signature motif containing protein [Actinomyces ruminicola]
MLEGSRVECPPAQHAGPGTAVLPVCFQETPSSAVQSLMPGSGSDPEAFGEYLAGIPAGAGLAGVVEGLLAGVLVPDRSSGELGRPGREAGVGGRGGVPGGACAEGTGTSGAVAAVAAEDDADDGLVDAAEVLGIPDMDALFAAIPSPVDHALAGVSRRVGPDWGEGTGVDRLAALGGQVLSELVAACHRLGAWASWAEGVAAACLARTADMNRGVAPWGPKGQPEQVITDEEQRFTTCGEIACRLGVTRSSAGRILDRGQALLLPELAPTEVLHRAGLLDQSKTALIVGRLEGVCAEVSAAVQERVLARAPRRTASQLGRDIDRALAALDPEGIGGRRRRDVAHRHVGRPRQAGEGTHEMRLLLPSLDAFLLDATLDAIAASARAVGDERSLGQLRADALTGMALRTLQGSQHVACRSTRTSDASDFVDAGCRSGGPVGEAAAEIPVAVIPTAENSSAGDATGVAHGTFGAGRGGCLLPDGVPLEGLLGALSGLVEPSRPWWTPSGIDPVFPPPGIGINVDVTVPLTLLVPDDDHTGGAPPGGEDGSRGASGMSLPTGSGGSAPAAVDGIETPVVVDGSSAPAAHGRSQSTTNGAGLYAGGGDALPLGTAPTAEVVIGRNRAPIPAATARALALGGVWRRLVTDPLSGAVVDVGRSHYRPPAALRDLVQARDQACTFPGCTVPAARCDIDHVISWAEGGTTSLNNLTCLCQAHHRLKHTPGWTLTRQDDDALLWTTPSGARYRRAPEGTVTLLPRRVGPRQLQVSARIIPEREARAVDGAVVERLRRGLEMASRRGGPGHPPQVTSRGPRPGQPVGAFEAHPYPAALHDLGLAPLLDKIPPF